MFDSRPEAWRRIRVNCVAHSSGFEVYSRGRFHIGYSDATLDAVIEIEHCVGQTALYLSELVVRSRDGLNAVLTEVEREELLQRVEAGMIVMDPSSPPFRVPADYQSSPPKIWRRSEITDVRNE